MCSVLSVVVTYEIGERELGTLHCYIQELFPVASECFISQLRFSFLVHTLTPVDPPPVPPPVLTAILRLRLPRRDSEDLRESLGETVRDRTSLGS